MSLVQYDNSIPKIKKEKTAITIAIDFKNKPIVKFMDRTKLTRDQKIESLNGFDDRNEPTWHTNEDGSLTLIKNNNPIKQTRMLKFPNCEHCNTDHAVILIEEII